ncbi:CCHC-type zinc finger nucleic acid binding protein isoform X6 [Canis lupus dingo]|uniref:CCHC-type zinc finger nucleic acid binding protein isoform X6 n=1 Tax=Canis lupus dingo TaxID=286419 RepID=UPI0020C43DFC|nr:CCHC-type zinc finger nucleic acid binding protein isoform X6 [Canis lupus dingo]
MSSNECFKCGRSGHWARECPTGGGRGRGMRSRGRGGFTSDRGFQFVSSSLPDICYRCGESGHLAKDCDLQEDVLVCFFSLLLKPAITAVEVATSPRTARSPRESGSNAATTVANQAIWLVTVTMLMSRSAILVENLDTFKKTAPK